MNQFPKWACSLCEGPKQFYRADNDFLESGGPVILTALIDQNIDAGDLVGCVRNHITTEAANIRLCPHCKNLPIKTEGGV